MPAHQMHLKYSNGSRQARQRCSALHGVEPNSLMHSVSVDVQRGQATGVGPRRISRMEEADLCGGTMPYSNNLRRPSTLIQSLVHAGCSTLLTSKAPIAASRSADSTERRITSVAGQ